jgi:Uma2 family endonuclease
MAADAAERRRMTRTEFLAFERASDTKHSYVAGELFDMAGASFEHNVVASNLTGELRALLRDRPCLATASDLRVWLPATETFTYPDVVVVCGERRFEPGADLDTLLNPTVVIEVLSRSTEAYDRGEKFEGYRSIPSLKEYVLVGSERQVVERYTREEDGWKLRPIVRGEPLVIAAIEAAIPWAEIYAKLSLPTSPSAASREAAG